MKFPQLKILLLFMILHSFKFAQGTDYPMRFLSEYINGTIDLVGGDPELAVRCLQSDFGEGAWESIETVYQQTSTPYTRYCTKITWKNILRKDWSNVKCNLSITYSIGPHPQDGDYVRMRIAYMVIECKDINGKDLLAAKTKSGVAIRNYVNKKLLHGYGIVNSIEGINVRKEPSLTSEVVYKLKDQSKVVLMGKTGQWTDIKKGNSTVKTQWVEVFINTKLSGYVAEAFLM